MTIDLNDYQLLSIFVVSLVVLLAAAEIGRLGRGREHRMSADTARDVRFASEKRR